MVTLNIGHYSLLNAAFPVNKLIYGDFFDQFLAKDYFLIFRQQFRYWLSPS